MRSKTIRYTQIGTVAVAACALLFGCGEGSVTAIDLASGKQQTFGSKSDVPAGWVICIDDVCESVVGQIPCQNLGPLLCDRADHCELGELCPQDGPAECKTFCMDKRVQNYCESITDPVACAAREDCAWEAGEACPTPEPCTIPERCVTKRVQECVDLSQPECGLRTDCEWVPVTCDCAPSLPSTECDCPAFCQPKNVCPPFPLAIPTCFGSEVAVLEYDAQGCPTSHYCVPSCNPSATQPIPLCPGSWPVPIFGESGCLDNWECAAGSTPPPPPNTLPTDPRCQQLANEYAILLAEAQACNVPLPGVSEPNVCSAFLPTSIACDCKVPVNSSAATALIDRLNDLLVQSSDCPRDEACSCVPTDYPSCEGDEPGGPGRCR